MHIGHSLAWWSLCGTRTVRASRCPRTTALAAPRTPASWAPTPAACNRTTRCAASAPRSTSCNRLTRPLKRWQWRWWRRRRRRWRRTTVRVGEWATEGRVAMWAAASRCWWPSSAASWSGRPPSSRDRHHRRRPSTRWTTWTGPARRLPASLCAYGTCDAVGTHGRRLWTHDVHHRRLSGRRWKTRRWVSCGDEAFLFFFKKNK